MESWFESNIPLNLNKTYKKHGENHSPMPQCLKVSKNEQTVRGFYSWF